MKSFLIGAASFLAGAAIALGAASQAQRPSAGVHEPREITPISPNAAYCPPGHSATALSTTMTRCRREIAAPVCVSSTVISPYTYSYEDGRHYLDHHCTIGLQP